MTYANKEDILGVLKFFHDTYTMEDVSDTLQFLATTDVNTEIYKAGLTVPVTDIGDMLKASEICFYMEHGGMVGEIENAFGVVRERTIGNYKARYENGMPMFFFAQGASDPFLALLPHETWRMRGYKYVGAWLLAYRSLNSATINPYGAMVQDNTARGYGWRDAVSDPVTGTELY